MKLGLVSLAVLLGGCTQLGLSPKESAKKSRSEQAAADAPHPSEVTIRSIAYAGSGCPADTVATNISTTRER